MRVETVNLILALIGFAVIVAGGVVYLRSSLVRARHEELERLAETRGQRNADLEVEVADLRSRLEAVENQLKVYQALKAKEIAIEVAKVLRPYLPEVPLHD